MLPGRVSLSTLFVCLALALVGTHAAAFPETDLALSDDPSGSITGIIDPRGIRAIRNEYDEDGRLIAQIDGLSQPRTGSGGNRIEFTHDIEGRLEIVKDRGGNSTVHVYDHHGNVFSETNALGETTQRTYDDFGNELTRIDPLGNVWSAKFDEDFNQIEDTNPLGETNASSYNDRGLLLTQTAPDGTVILSNQYDGRDKPTTITDALGQTTAFDYAFFGLLTTITDARGQETQFSYDSFGNIARQVDANGAETRFTYDADGNQSRTIDAKGNSTRHIHDALDRRIETILPDATPTDDSDNLRTRTEYDALERVTAEIDEAGNRTEFGYDAIGRLISVTVALGNVTQSEYDEQGNRTAQIDAEGRVTRWEYDALGRATVRILPLGQREEMRYDANGNLEQVTDFNGTTIVHQYDVNDRLIGRAFPNDPAEAVVYDPVGNRIQTADGQGTKTYAYDERNRLVREILPDGTTLGYGYDAEGNRIRLTLTSASGELRETLFGYDALNRLVAVTDASSGITQYRYDSNGNRDGMTYPNGTRTEYTYNTRNQLTALATTDSTGQVAVAYTYDLHPTGRRLGSTEHSGRVTQYTLDSAYRLLSESITDPVNGNYSAEYQYDRVGNRTQSILDGVQTAYAYDDNDRLLQAGGERYTYDANGNTLRVEIDSDLTTYQYDDRNRMVASSNTAGGSTTTSIYRYDLDGNRIAQTVDGETTEYTVDRNRDFAQVIREFSPSRDIHYTHGDDLIGQQSAAGAFYYHYDGLGSTRALTDNTEAVTDTYDYEAFGDLLNRTGLTDNNYLYTGEQYDPNLDQYYLRARYYNQGIGRFTQMDTFQGAASDPITLHKYLYASADPVNNIDPSGNFSLVPFAVAQDIRTSLSTLQTDVGLSILDAALDPDNAGRNAAIGLGVAALGGVASFKLLRLLSGKFRQACNSFDGDTPIWTENGMISISEVNIGDLVWAFDEETGEVVLQPVVHTIERDGDHELVLLIMNSGETITTTPSHPFYVIRNGEWNWIEANQLAAGDVIKGAGQQAHVITGIETANTDGPVFNLTVDKDHTYFIGDGLTLAHNANRCQPLTIPQSRLRHLFDGDATGGFHHRAGGLTPSGRKVLRITDRGTGKLRGVYRAKIQICEGGRCFKKSSTVFPDSWSKSRVQAEITQAYNEFIVKNNGKSPAESFVGKSTNGFPIEMRVRDGRLVTAFPKLD